MRELDGRQPALVQLNHVRFRAARLTLLIVLSGVLFSTVAPLAVAATNSSQGRTAGLESRIGELEHQLRTERAVREQQGNDAEYYFNAVAIVVGVATLVIAVVAIGFTFAGYRLVRDYVTKEFDRRAGKAFDEQVQPALNAKFDAMVEEYDAKFAELVATTRAATRIGDGG